MAEPSNVSGTIWSNHHVGRDGKWKVTMEEFPKPIFAKSVCPGSGYLMTGDTIGKLKDAIKEVCIITICVISFLRKSALIQLSELQGLTESFV